MLLMLGCKFIQWLLSKWMNIITWWLDRWSYIDEIEEFTAAVWTLTWEWIASQREHFELHRDKSECCLGLRFKCDYININYQKNIYQYNRSVMLHLYISFTVTEVRLQLKSCLDLLS